MAKCDFDKVAKQVYWNDTSAWVFCCKFAAYFQNTFSWEHLWSVASETIRQLLLISKFSQNVREYGAKIKSLFLLVLWNINHIR